MNSNEAVSDFEWPNGLAVIDMRIRFIRAGLRPQRSEW